MKLELKHLAPYLPYGLKLQKQNGSLREYTLLGCGSGWNKDKKTNIVVGHKEMVKGDNIEEFKPILRPLSDLHKEDIIVMYPNVLDAPYYVVQDLIKLHFDIFGLIEKGLAIDINTL